MHDHCLTMIKDIKELQKLSLMMDKELQLDLILQSFPDSYGQFIMNYYINKIDYTLSKLLNLLVTAEGTLKSLKRMVFAVEQTFSKRKSTVKKKNKKSTKKQKTMSGKKKKAPKEVNDKEKYFYCNFEGH